MPNTFAYFMIFAWPVLALMAFRRLPLPASLSAALIGALLLLPTRTGVDLPMLPAYDKNLAGILAAFLLIWQSTSKPGFGKPAPEAMTILPGWLPRGLAERLCLLGILCGSAITVITNGEPLSYGPLTLPGLTYYDVLSAVLTQGVALLPFLIARKYLATAQAQKYFLVVLVIAALLYSFPTLWEVRMSPQLNRQFYGFFPHSWLQHLRQDGYRPLVFLTHGLRLSLLLCLAFLGALAWARLAPRSRKGLLYAAAGFLFVTLVLSKSLGALGIAVLLAPVVVLAPRRLQLLAAASIAAVTLTYPILRGQGLMPVERVVSLAEIIDAERAGSLEYRLKNEDILLEKAREKPAFGWGGWGRSRVYDEKGVDRSITDGTWVILFGTGGWVLYLSTFGLLSVPILLLARRGIRVPPDAISPALALLLAANMIDLIPNSGLLPITWFMAGALAGRLELARAGSEYDAVGAAGPGPVPDPRQGALPSAVFSPRIAGPAQTSLRSRGSLFAPQQPDRGRSGTPPGSREP